MSYIPGEWWVLCDVCQRKARSSEVTKRWDGLIVHADPEEGCFETRHPQEFIRPVRDNYPLPFVRPDNEGIDAVETIDCSCHYPIEVDYLIQISREIFKGHTLAPASGVIIVDPAVVTVHCQWVIE